jgi:hypothetical protein
MSDRTTGPPAAGTAGRTALRDSSAEESPAGGASARWVSARRAARGCTLQHGRGAASAADGEAGSGDGGGRLGREGVGAGAGSRPAAAAAGVARAATVAGGSGRGLSAPGACGSGRLSSHRGTLGHRAGGRGRRRGRRGGRAVRRGEDGRPLRLVQGVLAFVPLSGARAEGSALQRQPADSGPPALDQRGGGGARGAPLPSPIRQQPSGSGRQSPAAVRQRPRARAANGGAVSGKPPTAGM